MKLEPHWAAHDLISIGHTWVSLDGTEVARLFRLYREATRFFSRSVEEKLRYSVPGLTTGYRHFRASNTGSADRPDSNDSFLWWGSHRLPPGADEIADLLEAADDWRLLMRDLITTVLEGLAHHYGRGRDLAFDKASVLQVNSFLQPTDAEFTHYSHEDADLLTVIWCSDPGLESVARETEHPVEFEEDMLLVMPGSILTAMTGGEIRPFYHQVRNLGIRDRKSVMYFVTPDTDTVIEPFVLNETTENIDFRRLALDNPQENFGLSPDFVAAS